MSYVFGSRPGELELAVATPADRRLRAAVRALLETIERQAGVIVPSEREREERQ